MNEDAQGNSAANSSRRVWLPLLVSALLIVAAPALSGHPEKSLVYALCLLLLLPCYICWRIASTGVAPSKGRNVRANEKPAAFAINLMVWLLVAVVCLNGAAALLRMSNPPAGHWPPPKHHHHQDDSAPPASDNTPPAAN